MGAAPLVFLAEHLTAVSSVKPPVVLLGARTKTDLLCLKDFRKAGCRVITATDDGSCGRRGFVSCQLEELLKGPEAKKAVIYSCGPRPMLNSVYALADTAGIPAYVSLEAHMACGIGACLGCNVATTAGNKRVCKDGPVFNAQDILWGQSDEN
jgi:dihydroorotate dehydrogenase electron transfer subunit